MTPDSLMRLNSALPPPRRQAGTGRGGGTPQLRILPGRPGKPAGKHRVECEGPAPRGPRRPPGGTLLPRHPDGPAAPRGRAKGDRREGARLLRACGRPPRRATDTRGRAEPSRPRSGCSGRGVGWWVLPTVGARPVAPRPADTPRYPRNTRGRCARPRVQIQIHVGTERGERYPSGRLFRERCCSRPPPVAARGCSARAPGRAPLPAQAARGPELSIRAGTHFNQAGLLAAP